MFERCTFENKTDYRGLPSEHRENKHGHLHNLNDNQPSLMPRTLYIYDNWAWDIDSNTSCGGAATKNSNMTPLPPRASKPHNRSRSRDNLQVAFANCRPLCLQLSVIVYCVTWLNTTTAFIFDSLTDVLLNVIEYLRQKMTPPEGDSNLHLRIQAECFCIVWLKTGPLH